MSRIGQILIREGLATEGNVARALGVQRFAGARLGTLLLERGTVAEDELGKALGRQLRCEYIPWQMLGDVPPTTIDSLPAKFAVRHAAVPYEQGEGYLKIVLRDPGDLLILDELFFVTGHKVIPAVAPEVRIYQALEKYYGERRTPRFAILAEKLSRSVARTITRPASPPPSFFSDASPKPPRSPLPHEIWGEGSEPETVQQPIIQDWKITDAPAVTWGASPRGEPEPEAEEETISWEETPPSPPVISWAEMSPPPLWISEAPPSPRERPAPRRLSEAGGRGEGGALAVDSAALSFIGPEPGRFEESRAESSAGPRAAAPGALPGQAQPPPPAHREPVHAERVFPATMPAAADFPEVLAARGRDSISAAALAAMARRFPRGAIFAVKPGGVSGWDATGERTDREALRSVEIPWTEPSIFLNVRLSRSFYLGPLPPLSRHEAIAKAMGGPAEDCLVQPVLIREKPLAFLYAEFARERGATPMDLAYMRELASAAASAFAASIRLKKKEVV